MGNYDTSRSGYRDREEMTKYIDLDFGASVAVIAIETVAASARSLHM